MPKKPKTDNPDKPKKKSRKRGRKTSRKKRKVWSSLGLLAVRLEIARHDGPRVRLFGPPRQKKKSSINRVGFTGGNGGGYYDSIPAE